MGWILGSGRHDILAFYLPGLVAGLLVHLLPADGPFFAIFAFVVTAAIDTGHVYTTSWRVFRNPTSTEAKLSFTVILLVAGISGTWMFFSVPYFWSFVLYFTVLHHIRQFFGLTRWYLRLAMRDDRISTAFLYALTLLPFLAFHFRSGMTFGVYTTNDFFFLPNPAMVRTLAIAWSLVLGAWIFFEVRLWTRGLREPGRVLSIGAPALFHGGCFFLGRTFAEVAFPLLALHGMTYMTLIGLSVNRLAPTRRRPLVLGILVGGSALIAALWDRWIEGNFASFSYENHSVGGPQVAAAVLLITPVLSHYVIDAFIWKRRNEDAGLIYGDR